MFKPPPRRRACPCFLCMCFCIHLGDKKNTCKVNVQSVTRARCQNSLHIHGTWHHLQSFNLNQVCRVQCRDNYHRVNYAASQGLLYHKQSQTHLILLVVTRLQIAQLAGKPCCLTYGVSCTIISWVLNSKYKYNAFAPIAKV